jgi:hypothetical protein
MNSSISLLQAVVSAALAYHEHTSTGKIRYLVVTGFGMYGGEIRRAGETAKSVRGRIILLLSDHLVAIKPVITTENARAFSYKL